MKQYTIEIASLPDRENLVAEIWDGDVMIAEINQDSEELTLEVYCSEKRRPLVLNYDAFIEVLKNAKEKLK